MAIEKMITGVIVWSPARRAALRRYWTRTYLAMTLRLVGAAKDKEEGDVQARHELRAG